NDFERFEKQQLLEKGAAQSYVPEDLLSFLRDRVAHRRGAIRSAQELLEPNPLRRLLDKAKQHQTSIGVRHTFVVGIEQVYELLRENPEWEFEPGFQADQAMEFMESKLIDFDPDEWLNRTRELLPVRTHRADFALPIQLRVRLEELHRCYVFGCWL